MSNPSPPHPALELKETESDSLRDADKTVIAEELDAPLEADVADKPVAAGEAPHPTNDFLDYQDYRVNGTIVHRLNKVIYQNDRENLIERQDIKYLGFQWRQVVIWTNQDNETHQYRRMVEEGLRILEGQESERNFGISASFKGLGISAGGYSKRFSEFETSSVQTIETTVTVAPQATTILYQKEYTFETDVWFWQRVLYWSEHNHFSVGTNATSNQPGERIRRTAKTSILAEEYATVRQRLSGETTITAVPAPALSNHPPVRRQFQNITANAKTVLSRWGINGNPPRPMVADKHAGGMDEVV